MFRKCGTTSPGLFFSAPDPKGPLDQRLDLLKGIVILACEAHHGEDSLFDLLGQEPHRRIILAQTVETESILPVELDLEDRLR